MWLDHNACGETQHGMRLEWQAIAKLRRALNTQQRTVNYVGSHWGSWSKEVTLIELLCWILIWCCVQDRMKGDNLEMAAKSRGEVVRAWTLTKETNDVPKHTIIEFSFVLKVLWTFPWFIRQELYQAFIWHPTHFHSTCRGKLILELKIITGLTLGKWKEMYPRWEKGVIGLTIFQLSREDQFINLNKSARVPCYVFFAFQCSGSQSKDPRCLGALEGGFNGVQIYPNISKNT